VHCPVLVPADEPFPAYQVIFKAVFQNIKSPYHEGVRLHEPGDVKILKLLGFFHSLKAPCFAYGSKAIAVYGKFKILSI
jgi:glutamate dehydrogenase/leucine dehydrogenase